jgi:hypothetical protein
VSAPDKKPPTPTIIGDAEVGAELLAQSIIDVSEAAKKLLGSRLSRRALVVLLHDASGVAKRDIELVLDHAADLRRRFVK